MLDNFVYVLVVGLVAGFLAGQVMKGRGFGLIGNIVVGVIGAFVGSFLFGLLGISVGGLIGTLVMAFVGAVVLIYLIRVIKKL